MTEEVEYHEQTKQIIKQFGIDKKKVAEIMGIKIQTCRSKFYQQRDKFTEKNLSELITFLKENAKKL